MSKSVHNEIPRSLAIVPCQPRAPPSKMVGSGDETSLAKPDPSAAPLESHARQHLFIDKGPVMVPSKFYPGDQIWQPYLVLGQDFAARFGPTAWDQIWQQNSVLVPKLAIAIYVPLALFRIVIDHP